MKLKYFGRKGLALISLALPIAAVAQAAPQHAWDQKALSSGERAALVLKQMTLDEKIAFIHGYGMPIEPGADALSNGGAGGNVGVPRLGIPRIEMADAAYGVTRSAPNGRYATALPSVLAATSSWEPKSAYAYGALIGTELRQQGYNMTLGGGVNLTREPRDGRTFEYAGEDPLLAGTMDGNLMRGEQDQHVLGDIKHYAINDQEDGRFAVNAEIDKRSMRESDLLAFQIALEIAHPSAVMCSYNRVNSVYSCENDYLLHDVLKGDFHFDGFVISDWGGTHSTAKASHAGLDMEQPEDFFYGAEMKKQVQAGTVPMAELDDHVLRILRAEFASGVVDDPPQKGVVDADHGNNVAQTLAEKSIVLLKNDHSILPLDASKPMTIAVIGSHADVAIIGGGGSAQVDPPGGSPVPPPPPGNGVFDALIRPAWFRDSPLKAIQAEFPKAHVVYASGDDIAAAASLAHSADVALVFGSQWSAESLDLKTLDLGPDQDALIAAVGKANPRTIAIVESGGPIVMPWHDQVGGIVEAWFPGIRGAEALASILSGAVNPSAKLPVSFPLTEADLPHPKLNTPPAASEPHINKGDTLHDVMKELGDGLPTFPMVYDEKLKVGYKWYDAEHTNVLFPFGHGLSYTTYAYSGLSVERTATGLTIHFTVQNTGKRAGDEIAQVYAALPASAGEPPHRLVGWSRLALAPGESKLATITVDRRMLSIFDEKQNAFSLLPGSYQLLVGASSRDLGLKQEISLK
ncbi:beta-glucosidase family protein [Granulicella tundricola]|uniref:Beta-glucosidase n=1 Tax=Granulicella tundricola (strain ATCC BAA-1859 / DSM 23138 / MP5ACTX9) TaxID=1198114 RepID=E8X6M7_GRATM|nr:glycoside hydrolase family 3 C-terminal domain-containing protein [Granulicella tundricola]ADW71177.1 Beta-glucosidase [Granulicella tundricola MP5ACTX9]